MEDNRPSAPTGGRGLRIGRILGIPVYVSATWLVIAAVIVVGYAPLVSLRLPELSSLAAYATAAVFVVLLFASVLLHELGHALVAKQQGIGVRAMTLWMLGGYTEMEREPRTPAGEFLVALAGPVVSLVLGLAGLAGVVTLESGVARELAIQVALSNLSVAVFNVLPGLPLDGGSLVRAAVWKVGGNRHAGTIAAGHSGRVVAVLVIVCGLALSLTDVLGSVGLIFTVMVGVFLWFGATQSVRAGTLARRLPLLDARRLARPCLTVPPDLPLAEALRRAQEVGARSLVVVDPDGTATGVVAEHAATAVPPERRPWVPVSAVARTLEPGMIVHADLTGEGLINALRTNPRTEYLVSEADRVVGVLVTTDVAETLDPKGSTR
jgi:Zn-dependent protease/CBS domain-containing protein